MIYYKRWTIEKAFNNIALSLKIQRPFAHTRQRIISAGCVD